MIEEFCISLTIESKITVFFLSQNNVEDAQEAFDAFFDHYPYCYGYWKKFADILKKNDMVDKAIAVSCNFFLKFGEINFKSPLLCVLNSELYNKISL